MKSYEYEVTQIGEATYRLDEYAKTHSYLLVGSEKALLIDTGCGCGHLGKTVESITDKEIIVVNSHGHLDHVGSNYQFEYVWIASQDEALMWDSTSIVFRNERIRSYLLSLDSEFEENELERTIRTPQVKKVYHLTDGQVFDLGDRKIEAIATPGHTQGCYCFLDREREMLFTADTVCDISILLFLENSGSVETYYRSIERLYNRRNEYKVLYPGHHTPALSVDYMHDYLMCARGIMKGSLESVRHIEAIGDGWKSMYGLIGIVYKKEWISDADRASSDEKISMATGQDT
ncbi:MAG: MBL fold metallo-hydrolase [Lachnospiraceae bacterium]|nr:MBL fold metallo-hydrolase [Lachnospiraceae bacterium]